MSENPRTTVEIRQFGEAIETFVVEVRDSVDLADLIDLIEAGIHCYEDQKV